jgi:hypothetical protein
MSYTASFPETPNGPVAVVHVQPPEIADELYCERVLRLLGRRLGGMPVVLRCRVGSVVLCSGDEHLYRYAQDPSVEFVEVVSIDLCPPSADAA